VRSGGAFFCLVRSTNKLMLWNTKKEIPIGSGNFNRKSIGATPVELGDAGSTNRNLYLKKPQAVRG
jgi:hypothetical protein